jgi:hypothetical protein
MVCPRCQGLMRKKSYVRPSQVFKLGPGYFNVSHTAEYYIEFVWTCRDCTHRVVKWRYAHSDRPRRFVGRA